MAFEEGRIDLSLAEEADQRVEAHRSKQALLRMASGILFRIIEGHTEALEFTLTEEELAELTQTSDYRGTNTVLNNIIKAVDEAGDRAQLAAETSEGYAATVRQQL